MSTPVKRNTRTQPGINEELTVALGPQTVVLQKDFGMLLFAHLRIHADVTRNAWVIERDDMNGNYREWCLIPGQTRQDYDKVHVDYQKENEA